MHLHVSTQAWLRTCHTTQFFYYPDDSASHESERHMKSSDFAELLMLVAPIILARHEYALFQILWH